MNIYIYGNNSFKKEIHETLEHANIKFKLDSNSVIEDIEDLELLKSTIEANPNDIYLIDDEKIIKKNALNQKIKFLAPKDGIKEEFLFDNGIADLSVDSLKEIPKYILRKYEQQKEIEPNIQSSIIDIVDEAYEDDIDDIDDMDDINIELDEELAQLLSSSKNDDDEISNVEIKKDINLDELEGLIELEDDSNELSKEELTSLINFEEDVGLNNTTSDYDEQKIEEIPEENSLNINELEDTIEEEFKQGEDMSKEFTELDSLNEQDILNALEGINSPTISSNSNTSNEKIEVESSNVQDIAELISKLLNNKTLEITVKIKD
ncbi:hypothetical protein LPB137_12660 [Poseidonibacter parvus]|uniref:Uncharacterized protein n=1 Tax=Poseidonibacter parvus TaxID=1850254 RepID=A0A1P8KQ40_9BACT|nr:hypothetical protein [Poseidonibacter parvus]APW66647.1 hypothetical protein LPB137_12660 [Poseidonibacter parvus]